MAFLLGGGLVLDAQSWPPDIRLPARAALQCLICWVLLSGLTEVKEPRPLLSPSFTPPSLPSPLLTPRELVCLLLASVCCGTDLDQTYKRNLGLHGYLFDLLDLLTDGPCCLRPTSCRGHFRVVSGPLSEHWGGLGRLFNHRQCDVETETR